MTTVTTLTDQTFDEAVLASAVPVLVDFTAEWCPPCKAIEPILDELATELDGRLLITRVDVDEQQATALRYDVRSMPTLLVLVDGVEKQRLIGARGKRHLLEELSPYV